MYYMSHEIYKSRCICIRRHTAHGLSVLYSLVYVFHSFTSTIYKLVDNMLLELSEDINDTANVSLTIFIEVYCKWINVTTFYTHLYLLRVFDLSQ